jgi:hypothetical protein
MPKKPRARHPGGRPAERFKFGDATFEQIATKVSRTPKPLTGRPAPMTKIERDEDDRDALAPRRQSEASAKSRAARSPKKRKG